MKTALIIMLALGALIKITPLWADDKNSLIIPNEKARSFTKSIDPLFTKNPDADPNLAMHKPSNPEEVEAGITVPSPLSGGAALDPQLQPFPGTCCAKNETQPTPISLAEKNPYIGRIMEDSPYKGEENTK